MSAGPGSVTAMNADISTQVEQEQTVQPYLSIDNLESVLRTIEAQHSNGTREAYRKALAGYHRHLAEKGWERYPANPSRFIEQVLSYLQSLADRGLTYSSLNKHLSAIKHETGFENGEANLLLSSKPVKAFMEGIARQQKTVKPKQAQPLTLAELTTLHKHLSKRKTVRTIRDRALIAVGVATALRASNVGMLTLGDVQPALTIDGFVVEVRFSKTDQTGQGATIPVKRSGNKTLDPVKALSEWLGVLAHFGFTPEGTPDFPLFPTIKGQNGLQQGEMLNPHILITNLLRAHLVEAGVVSAEGAQAYSSHSLRSTFITLSYTAGVDERTIAGVSQHKSNAIRTYDRRSVEAFGQTDYLNG